MGTMVHGTEGEGLDPWLAGLADRPPALDAAAFERLAKEILPMSMMLDFTVEAMRWGRVRIRMPASPQLLRPGGTIAGPALMTLADLGMYALVMSCIGPVEMAVTSNLTMNFLRRPAAVATILEGRILRLGKRLAFGDCLLFSENDAQPVAQATITYALPPPA